MIIRFILIIEIIAEVIVIFRIVIIIKVDILFLFLFIIIIIFILLTLSLLGLICLFSFPPSCLATKRGLRLYLVINLTNKQIHETANC